MDDLIDKRFWLEDSSGNRFYPARMRDRASQRVAFRVSAGGNTKAHSRDIETLEEVARLVVREGYRVRVRPSSGSPTSLMKVGGRNNLTWGSDKTLVF